MNHESIFRLIFIAIFLTGFAISIRHRLRARREGGKISRASEGTSMIILRLVFALPLYGSMFLYMIHPPVMKWSALNLPVWLRITGVSLSLAALPLLQWLFSSIGRNISETILTKEHQVLVIHGPYRWVRHPLYSVASLALLGLSLVAANWFMVLMTLLGMIMLPTLAAKEETNLLQKFGEEYRHYMQRTGRFLPQLKPAQR